MSISDSFLVFSSKDDTCSLVESELDFVLSRYPIHGNDWQFICRILGFLQTKTTGCCYILHIFHIMVHSSHWNQHLLGPWMHIGWIRLFCDRKNSTDVNKTPTHSLGTRYTIYNISRNVSLCRLFCHSWTYTCTPSWTTTFGHKVDNSTGISTMIMMIMHVYSA